MTIDVPVVVVGAGLTGLVVADDLAAHGIPCAVLESQPRTGGRIRTVMFPDGVTAEAHLEEFREGSPAYALLRRFGLPTEKDATHPSIVLGGELRVRRGNDDRDEYLASVFDRSGRDAFMAWNASARAALERLCTGKDPLAGPTLARSASTSLSAFVRASTPTSRVAEWVRMVVESETAVEWDRIAALDGLADLAPFLDTPRGFGERSAHVRAGNQRLVDALEDNLPYGTVRTRALVTRIVDHGRHVDVHHHELGRKAVVRCEQVVITVPSWSLRLLDIRPGLGAAADAALATVRAGSYVKVILRLRPEGRDVWRRHGPGLFPLLTAGPAGRLRLGGTRAGDNASDLVLTMVLHGPHARRLAGRPVDEIRQQAIDALESLRARQSQTTSPALLLQGISRQVTDARVYDYQQAVAYWPVDHGRSRFDRLAATLRAPHGRVHLGGDTTDGTHSDAAVRAAHRVASVVAARLGVVGEASA